MTLVPERIRRAVLLSAVIPEDRTRALDQIDPTVRTTVESGIADGVYSVDTDAAAAMLCNDADDEQSAFILDHIVDDAAALLAESVDLSGYRLPVPRPYVRTMDDRCYPPALQAEAAERIDAAPIDIDAGHMAMVTAPEQIASVLNK